MNNVPKDLVNKFVGTKSLETVVQDDGWVAVKTNVIRFARFIGILGVWPGGGINGDFTNPKSQPYYAIDCKSHAGATFNIIVGPEVTNYAFLERNATVVHAAIVGRSTIVSCVRGKPNKASIKQLTSQDQDLILEVLKLFAHEQ